MTSLTRCGFALIELSIVLVIIGLIVGGVLVGRDLIRSASIRAEISQIERYQTAVNTFKLKYNYLPGDIKASEVTALGFSATPVRDGVGGNGDGNGILQSYEFGNVWGGDQDNENLYFWEDLTTNSKLLEGGFSSAINGGQDIASGTIDQYVPKGKIGKAYIQVFSMYSYSPSTAAPVNAYPSLSNGINFFGLCGFDYTELGGWKRGGAPLSVIETYNIDNKIDDGYPKTGKARAFGHNPLNGTIADPEFGYFVNAATSSTTTCFNTSTSAGVYSTDSNGGNGINCGLAIEIR